MLTSRSPLIPYNLWWMTSPSPRPAASRFRWVICALLFFATVIAYIDRGIFGYLKETLQHDIGWDDIAYGNIVASFKVAYGIGLCVAGWFTDRLGTRRGFAIAIVLWSVAAMSPGLATSALTFGIAMFFLGLGEAANFPACIKTVAEWFPRKERALSTGVFNSGANFGNMLVPVVVPFLAATVGWRSAFGVAGATGFIWLAFWLFFYTKPEHSQRVSPEELALIQSDPPETLSRIPWLRLLPRKETWAFALAKLCSDPVWWFYTFWLPGYWQRTFHLSIESNRLPVMLAFGVSILGSIYGGYLSGFLLKRGKSVNVARKTALAVCVAGILPVIFVPFIHSLWVVVGLVALAMASHQGWSANLFTLPSDLFPKAAVASVVGIGGMIGAGGGAVFDIFVGHIVTWTHSYVPVFAVCGGMYVLGLAFIQLLAPRLTPAKFQ
jgi:MFS transporter, ACS family, hexuronate transporter